MILELTLQYMCGKFCWLDLHPKYFSEEPLSSGEDLLASLIGFLEIRLIFKKRPIRSSNDEGSGGLGPY